MEECGARYHRGTQGLHPTHKHMSGALGRAYKMSTSRGTSDILIVSAIGKLRLHGVCSGAIVLSVNSP